VRRFGNACRARPSFAAPTNNPGSLSCGLGEFATAVRRLLCSGGGCAGASDQSRGCVRDRTGADWVDGRLSRGADGPEERTGSHLHSRVMGRFRALAEENANRALYMAEISAAVGVSGRTLRSCCRKHLGMGANQYLILRRLHLAEHGPQRQRCGDRQARIAWLAASVGPWLSLSGCDRRTGKARRSDCRVDLNGTASTSDSDGNSPAASYQPIRSESVRHCPRSLLTERLDGRCDRAASLTTNLHHTGIAHGST
jgi:AraC-like DNA-binding protein